MAVISVLEWSTMMGRLARAVGSGAAVGKCVAVGLGSGTVADGAGGVAEGAPVAVTLGTAVAVQVGVCAVVGVELGVSADSVVVAAGAVEVDVIGGSGLAVAVVSALAGVGGWSVGVTVGAIVAVSCSFASCGLPGSKDRARIAHMPAIPAVAARATSTCNLDSLSIDLVFFLSCLT
jgi:hypothetical protein